MFPLASGKWIYLGPLLCQLSAYGEQNINNIYI